MSTILGRFYFKLTDNKNLIGEFSNDHKTCKRNYTESADLTHREQNDGKFIGEYFSTWREQNGGKLHESVLAKLKIEQKPGCENIFDLKWWRIVNEQPEAKPFFCGEGMLCEGMLIGNYQVC